MAEDQVALRERMMESFDNSSVQFPEMTFDVTQKYVPIGDYTYELESIRDMAYHPVDTFQFGENAYLVEAYDYILSTYKEHYVDEATGKQAIEDIFESGHGIGFCFGNIRKYTNRFGKKEGRNRKDVLKTIHYALYILYLLDMEDKLTTTGEDDGN